MASPNDFGFDLLPPDPGLLNPDLALEAALTPVVELGEPDEVPLGKGWSFDFINGRFVRAGQAPAEVRDIDNMRVWIEKTLRTARHAHPIYTDAYGMIEPDSLIGEPFDAGLVGQWQQNVVDALLVHDRIASVDDFHFEQDPFGEQLYVWFTVTLDSADEQVIQVSRFPLSQAAQ